MLMTKEEALAFKERWRIVNEFTNEEIRQTPPTVKLRQLAVLFQFGREMGWEVKLRQGEEEAAAQARWRRLQETYAQKA